MVPRYQLYRIFTRKFSYITGGQIDNDALEYLTKKVQELQELQELQEAILEKVKQQFAKLMFASHHTQRWKAQMKFKALHTQIWKEQMKFKALRKASRKAFRKALRKVFAVMVFGDAIESFRKAFASSK